MVAISVLTTSYNAGNYLSEAIQSLLLQSFGDFEVILVDNGSTDGSIEHANVRDVRIRLIRLEDNIGRTPALALALNEAQGTYIAILDADDIAKPDRFLVQEQFLRKNLEVQLVGTGVEFIDWEGRGLSDRNCYVGEVSHDDLAERNLFFNSSVMFRRHTAVELGGYDSQFEYAQDYDLFVRLATAGRAVILADKLTKVRISNTNYTSSKGMRLVRLLDEQKIFKEIPKRLVLSPRGVRLNRRRQAISNLALGAAELLDERRISGVRTLCRGVLIDPTFSWLPYLTRLIFRLFIQKVHRHQLDLSSKFR
jgi:glycosyltransferase involved in cell wall biosynthesis